MLDFAPLDGRDAAEAGGLRYVSDTTPGIRRLRVGRGFGYRSPDGKRVADAAVLRRIRALAIPPAWRAVWICPRADGHIQASGRDARGRKQYRYHVRWRAVRDENKYARMLSFAAALPGIRQQVERDLSLPGLPRQKVLAAVIRLLEKTFIRVGNEEYARANASFGLTTMRERHVRVAGSSLRFRFRGKGGKEHRVDISDRRLARLIRRCQELPGEELFKYVDDEEAVQSVGSADVNAYLREIAGDDFTAKDFRTWAGTVLTAVALQELAGFDSQTQARSNLVRAIEKTAKELNNTPAVCRKCYVHPAVIEAYLEGTMILAAEERNGQEPHLSPDEAAVLAFLDERLAGEPTLRAS